MNNHDHRKGEVISGFGVIEYYDPSNQRYLVRRFDPNKDLYADPNTYPRQINTWGEYYYVWIIEDERFDLHHKPRQERSSAVISSPQNTMAQMKSELSEETKLLIKHRVLTSDLTFNTSSDIVLEVMFETLRPGIMKKIQVLEEKKEEIEA